MPRRSVQFFDPTGSICPEPERPGEGRDRAPRIQIATWLALEYVPPRGPTICLLQKTSPTRAATSAPKLPTSSRFISLSNQGTFHSRLVATYLFR